MDIAPCPFCGKPAEYVCEDDHHGDYFRLGCTDEDCPAHWTYYTEPQENAEKCIARWNSRIPTVAQAVVERATEEACRRFSDEVEQYSQAHIDELASLGVQAHPAGKITVDRGNLRYAFIEGARFAAQPPAAPAPDQAWRDSQWLALSASEKACYHWPDDTDLHRQCRAAYIAGATDYAQPPAAPVHQEDACATAAKEYNAVHFPCSADIGGVYGAKSLPPGVSIATANKAIEFLEWLSGYIGHGPAVQISSDQMEYIRSKVHPLVRELGATDPAAIDCPCNADCSAMPNGPLYNCPYLPENQPRTLNEPQTAWQSIETAPFVSAKRYLIVNASEIPVIGFRYYPDGPWYDEHGHSVNPLAWQELPSYSLPRPEHS